MRSYKARRQLHLLSLGRCAHRRQKLLHGTQRLSIEGSLLDAAAAAAPASAAVPATDYGAEDEMMADPDMERKGAEIGDGVGVAVVFDE